MWHHALISIAALLASLLYRYHFGGPASVIDYPDTHYDYVVGEFRFPVSPRPVGPTGTLARRSRFQPLPPSYPVPPSYAPSIFNQGGIRATRNDRSRIALD